MSKFICDSKVNALVANNKVIEAIDAYNQTHKRQLYAKENAPTIVKIILTTSSARNVKASMNSPKDVRKFNRKHPIGVPFLCFMVRTSGNIAVIVGIESGIAEIVSLRKVIFKDAYHGSFKIKGVRYKVKDYCHGMPRYQAVIRNKRPRHKKMSLTSPVVTRALRNAHALLSTRAWPL